MTGVSVVLRGAISGLVVLTWALTSAAATKQPAADLTGVYAKEGAELVILQGTHESLVYYGANFPQGQSVGTCECTLVLQQAEPSRWTLKSTDSGEAWMLRVEPKELRLEVTGTPGCCGAGWPGTDSFDRTRLQPPPSCKVTAPRAHFHASDAQNTQRKAYLVTHDEVQAYVPAFEPDFVPGRFKGPKATTVGLLKREQLYCQEASPPAATAPVDAKPIAGKWLRVKPQDKRYIIEQYCAANTPRLDLKPDGTLQIDYGQEAETVKVTGLAPGAAAGTYTLQLTRDSGSRETLEWTVADAKLGIIRLKGGKAFFREGEFFVREEKKGGLPVKAEQCDEAER